MNKRTAYVYGGAAFLILVFGFRTLARTMGDYEWLSTILTPITVFALLFEFSLLMYYAYGVYLQDDSSPFQSSQPTAKNGPDLSGLNKIASSFDDYSKQLSEIKGQLGEYNSEIKRLNDKIDSLVDEQLDEKVKNILTKLVGKKI